MTRKIMEKKNKQKGESVQHTLQIAVRKVKYQQVGGSPVSEKNASV